VGDAIMVGRGDELDLITPTHFSMIAAVVDAELLVPLWERLYQKPPSVWLDAQLVLQARPAAAAVLRQMHLAALRNLASADAPWHDAAALAHLRDELLMEWIEALPERVDASQLPTVAARKRLVDRVCERMLAGADEPPTLLSVCREVGASRRKLNYCFQDVLGTSPVKYLRAVRLNGVRRELSAGRAGSVQEAAARWGFWHLGQFAQDYKQQFGELPSVTLRGTGE
jgi:AraC family ethanolamine operon transcriptional activator